jgi:hypothetical protein
MRRSLNAPQRPSQPSQRDDLLFLLFAQDIAHLTERNSPPVQCPVSAISLAGFQVSTHGRFWVSPEVFVSLLPTIAVADTLQAAGAEDKPLLGSKLSADSGAKTKLGLGED